MTTTATTTRAAVITAFGDPDVFAVTDLPVPAPGPGQVRVRVAYSTVNPIDLGTRQGRTVPADRARFPMVLGWDAEGTVESLGPGVSHLQVGDGVFATTPQPAHQNGTHADLVVLDADHVAHAPPGWDGGRAAALGLSGITAYQAVTALQLQPGQTVLVNNPVGFVGSLAVQLAKAAGVAVIAPVAPASARRAGDAGVDHLLTGENLTDDARRAVPGGVDAALDLVGGPTAADTFGAVRDSGRHATVIPSWWISGGQYEPARGITPVVVENRPNHADLGALADLARTGQLRIDIAAVYDLETLRQAHEHLSRPGTFGKIVIRH